MNFTAGQRWTYRTRPGETASRVLVMDVEADNVHIRLTGVAVRLSSGQAIDSFFMPIQRDVLAACVTTLEVEADPDFEGAHKAWTTEHDTRGQGFFTVELDRFLTSLEGAKSG